jgi:hypothetical protein
MRPVAPVAAAVSALRGGLLFVSATGGGGATGAPVTSMGAPPARSAAYFPLSGSK